jgi:hypothetical protein
MSTRPGTPWEEAARERYGFQPTANSGAVHGDADLRHKGGRFVVECKDGYGDHISIPKKQLLKMEKQALLFGDGNWARLMRTDNGRVVVAMNERLFETLLSVADGVIVCPDCKTKLQPDW